MISEQARSVIFKVFIEGVEHFRVKYLMNRQDSRVSVDLDEPPSYEEATVRRPNVQEVREKSLAVNVLILSRISNLF